MGTEPKIDMHRQWNIIRHKYVTFNNIVIAAAILITLSWVWGSLQAMERNYSLQKEVDTKEQQLELTKLQKQNLELQQRYYQTEEYQELAVRESLGLVMPGEKMIILPENSQAVIDADAKRPTAAVAKQEEQSNIEQWLNFLFGGNSRSTKK